jgi:hypothetical protein
MPRCQRNSAEWRERPSGRRGEQRDGVAPFHSPMPPALPSERIAHLSYGRRLLRCDDVHFVVGHLLQVLAVLDHIDGVGDERDRAGGIDVEVDRRADH